MEISFTFYLRWILTYFIVMTLDMQSTTAEEFQLPGIVFAFQVPGYPHISDEIGAVEVYFGSTYILFKTLKLNWMEAHIKCKRHGMVLTNFDSKEEFEFQANLIKNHITYPEGVVLLEVWIGASDLFNEGNFTWLDSGKPFSSFYNTPKGHPDNANDQEHCLEFRKHINGSNFWVNDIPCTYKLGVMCKST